VTDTVARAQLVIRGARGTMASPGPTTVRYGGNTSCVEVRLPGGQRVVLDAGTGLRTLTDELGPALARGDESIPSHFDLFLTHRHLDHVIGLPFLVSYTAHGGRVTLHCGNGSADEMEHLVRQFMSPPLFPAPPDSLGRIRAETFGTRGRAAVGSVRVEGVPAKHPGEAAILLVHDAAGLLFAYAPDNELALWDARPDVEAWRSALVQHLRGVPVLLHDAHWIGDESQAHAGWGHSSAQEATRFALACEAQRLVLAHHHPNRSDAAVDVLLAECRALVQQEGASMEIVAASEDMILEV